MWTSEGKKINRDQPLTEYPTPQFCRDSYISLNGPWEFALDENPSNHDSFTDEIVVPFAVETLLSGVTKRVSAKQVMHYRKRFTLPFGFKKGRVLLHFEAVDQVCDVYLNGVKIAHHEGGYLPFTADCMELKQGENEIIVDVWDDTDSVVFPRGKQSSRSRGIWYTSTSGIWGSVWLESVPNEVIQNLVITPLFDEKKVRIQVPFEGKLLRSSVVVSFGGKDIVTDSLDENFSCVLDLSSAFHPWSPETPALYDIRVSVNFDQVSGYFAMRKFSSVEFNGHRVFALNNKPYFLSGVLDQGYYPDGGLTPPSDVAMKNDIRLLKDMGFNTIRKHIKITNMRWYYHCDRMGMIVVQDFVNSGAPVKPHLFLLAPFVHLKIDDTQQYDLLGSGSEEGRKFFEEEMERVVAHLYSVPCIAVWTLFNEGWGQFDSVRLTERLRSLDPTRLIDSCSGWFDHGAGDFASRHQYFRKLRVDEDPERIRAITEFGAYSHICEGHTDTKKRTFYKYYRDKERLKKAIEALYQKQVAPLLKEGLSMAILTQFADVEQETNGLVTADRRIVKIERRDLAALNKLLHFEETPHD